ncbi:hypothetical protein VTN00DRAFT_2511 [Thermoascus crustaceus]|uniref:uncharacterized protein n=1 Tax=Thermoascus crustaceus TaxID=5088 RepID=UPI003744162C
MRSRPLQRLPRSSSPSSSSLADLYSPPLNRTIRAVCALEISSIRPSLDVRLSALSSARAPPYRNFQSRRARLVLSRSCHPLARRLSEALGKVWFLSGQPDSCPCASSSFQSVLDSTFQTSGPLRRIPPRRAVVLSGSRRVCLFGASEIRAHGAVHCLEFLRLAMIL